MGKQRPLRSLLNVSHFLFIHISVSAAAGSFLGISDGTRSLSLATAGRAAGRAAGEAPGGLDRASGQDTRDIQ